jgi:hypothetical protein
MQQNQRGPELSDATMREIGVHRGRLARIRHLRALYQERGDVDRIRRLDEIRQSELQRYERLMAAAGQQLDRQQIQRIEAAAGTSIPTGAATPTDETRRVRGIDTNDQDQERDQ